MFVDVKITDLVRSSRPPPLAEVQRACRHRRAAGTRVFCYLFNSRLLAPQADVTEFDDQEIPEAQHRHLSLSPSLSIYIYICIYVCIHVCIYIYIHTYT